MENALVKKKFFEFRILSYRYCSLINFFNLLFIEYAKRLNSIRLSIEYRACTIIESKSMRFFNYVEALKCKLMLSCRNNCSINLALARFSIQLTETRIVIN